MYTSALTILLTTLLALPSTLGAPTPADPAGTCTFNGAYFCATSFNGIEQCGYKADGTLGLLKIGDCPASTHCGLIGNIPYCLAN